MSGAPVQHCWPSPRFLHSKAQWPLDGLHDLDQNMGMPKCFMAAATPNGPVTVEVLRNNQRQGNHDGINVWHVDVNRQDLPGRKDVYRKMFDLWNPKRWNTTQRHPPPATVSGPPLASAALGSDTHNHNHHNNSNNNSNNNFNFNLCGEAPAFHHVNDGVQQSWKRSCTEEKVKPQDSHQPSKILPVLL